jgi:hypothetical protein
LRHPLWVWFQRLKVSERQEVLRERLPSGGLAVIREMLVKHQEGLLAGRHYFFDDVSYTTDARAHFALRSPEQKPNSWGYVFARPRPPEVGDIHLALWDAADAEFLGSLVVFASMRNAELDAWALPDMGPKKLMRLLVVCSRGRFLTTCPGLAQRDAQGLMCNFAMPWFEDRSHTALATHMAHMVELKLWREFICSHPQQQATIPCIPRPRYSVGNAERTRAQNDRFERELRNLRGDRKVEPMRQ